MTFAYFHLPPFVNVSSEGWGGIEPNFNKEFARKYNLKMEWFDAKYSWGKFVPETGRYEAPGWIMTASIELWFVKMERCGWSHFVRRC